ncbi:hypothetical protein DSOL_2409 [Desulfosporosinus metallidurans]|uniref:Uncharacterized protein n=1 Tax=Desulfosporosinus metallidurans TaxID=1888891 RepID=A0A1Q8QWK8_9FIRM|nr:hypothetical protein DSOL_2409 [Desulfosporosinus metallidurans]
MPHALEHHHRQFDLLVPHRIAVFRQELPEYGFNQNLGLWWQHKLIYLAVKYLFNKARIVCFGEHSSAGCHHNRLLGGIVQHGVCKSFSRKSQIDNIPAVQGKEITAVSLYFSGQDVLFQNGIVSRRYIKHFSSPLYSRNYENAWRQNGAPEHHRFWKNIKASIALNSGAIVLQSNKNGKNEECIILVHNVPDTGDVLGCSLLESNISAGMGISFQPKPT